MTGPRLAQLFVAQFVIFLLAAGSPAAAQEKLERVNPGIPVTALGQLPSDVGAHFGVF